jgi:hypothetical protein
LIISEAQPSFALWGNVSASRAECQIYLSISEAQPTFALWGNVNTSRAECQIFFEHLRGAAYLRPLGQREYKSSGMAPETIGPRLWHKAGARAVWDAKIH